MKQTFTELATQGLAELFTTIHSQNHLAYTIIAKTPIAVAAYLQRTLAESGSDTARLDIKGSLGKRDGVMMSFTLTARKNGDSVAFIPGFELGELGQDIVNDDDVEFDGLELDRVGTAISMNEAFMDDLIHAYAKDVIVNGVWVTGTATADDRTDALHFQRKTDAPVCAATVFCKILEVLANYKSSADKCTYDVEGFGTFTITPSKNGYEVTLTYSKELKAAMKNDELAQMIADRDD